MTRPGHLVVHLQDGGFRASDVLWGSRTAENQPFFVDVDTHTHADWVFSEPGTYLVEVEAGELVGLIGTKGRREDHVVALDRGPVASLDGRARDHAGTDRHDLTTPFHPRASACNHTHHW